MTRALGIAGILFCWLAAPAAAGEIADRFPDAAWEHVAPAAAGWSAEQLKSAEEWSAHIGSTAVIVIHHGAIVTEWPRLVHAYWNIGVVHGEATLYPLAGRPVKFFTPFAQK